MSLAHCQMTWNHAKLHPTPLLQQPHLSCSHDTVRISLHTPVCESDTLSHDCQSMTLHTELCTTPINSDALCIGLPCDTTLKKGGITSKSAQNRLHTKPQLPKPPHPLHSHPTTIADPHNTPKGGHSRS